MRCAFVCLLPCQLARVPGAPRAGRTAASRSSHFRDLEIGRSRRRTQRTSDSLEGIKPPGCAEHMGGGRLAGTLVGISAVVTGSPIYVLVRVLKHSNSWTQVKVRTTRYTPVCACTSPCGSSGCGGWLQWCSLCRQAVVSPVQLACHSPSSPSCVCGGCGQQIACRSPFFMAIMLLAGIARWRTPARAAFHARKLGWLGLAGAHCSCTVTTLLGRNTVHIGCISA